MRINQNIMAVNARNNLSNTEARQAKSLEKLSSGFRINRAGDDAAGLVISEGLRSQVGGLKMAVRNAQDGVSVVQTAEGALTETHAMLQRMRDLTVQAGNTGANDTNSRAAIKEEIDQLSAEITRVADTTKFGSVALLDGSYGVDPAKVGGFAAGATTTLGGDEVFTVDVGNGAVTVSLDAGAYSGDALATHLQDKIRGALTTAGGDDALAAKNVSVTSTAVAGGSSIEISLNQASAVLTLADGANTPLGGDLAMTVLTDTASAGSGTFQVGANKQETIKISIADMTADGLSVDNLAVDTDADVEASLTLIDAAIKDVSTQRGELGATQNRLEHTIRNLSVTAENLTASESRIRDTDMASEMMEFTRNQILSQAGTAMLAQANQVPQGVLSLLR